MKTKILYYGSCWPTNIGNAFVNLGAIQSLRAAAGKRSLVMHYGGMSSYLFCIHNRSENNLNIGKMTEFDYVVMGGMTQCVEHLHAAEPIVTDFLNRGAKIVIAGGGAQNYDDVEVEAVRTWMSRLPIYAFISRDTYSFEKYGDLATHSFDGIDSAFFVADDDLTPIPLCLPEFDVLAFDKMEEPRLINADESLQIELPSNAYDPPRPRGFKKCVREMVEKLLRRDSTVARDNLVPSPIDVGGRLVLRTHHSPWPTLSERTHFERPNTLISDLPSDYLSLYAQAHTVYSDRVHACIAALAYGNRAMLFGRKVPRLGIFERVGAGKILERVVRLDRENLYSEKRRQIEFLASVLD